MEIKTLEHTSHQAILKVFNHSFSDYLIPFKLNLEQLGWKIKTDNIRLDYSVGVFENDQLIAFILHGLNTIGDKKVIYNGGTGVIPDKRGNGLTKRMYQFILPILKQDGINQLVLEVISSNLAAIKSYQKVGYQSIRKLSCLRGSFVIPDAIPTYDIRTLNHYDWAIMQSFWDFEPSWQYSQASIEAQKERVNLIGVFIKEQLVAYSIINPSSNKLLQIAVDKNHRRKKIGLAMMNHIFQEYGNKASMINIEQDGVSLNEFLQKIGLEEFLVQNEMKMDLNN